ncbi:hypothetical protein F4604DRAFT_1680593 [Suillus subluteus]|nr:hypothetical protein F4604DRAFT_1680593 [Suillus subluteus]
MHPWPSCLGLGCDRVGARFQLLYAAMFTASKQLWVTLWEEPYIISIHQKIDMRVWQSSTLNVAASEAKGEDFTSDLMHLALANAGHKDSDSPTINEDPTPPIIPTTSPTIDTLAVIAPPDPPTVPTITPGMLPQATETIINPVPRSTVQLPVSLTGNTVNVPIVAVTAATDKFLPVVPAAVTAIITDGPDVTAVSDIPGNGETLSQAVASGSLYAQWGQGKKAGVLALVSLSANTAEQQCGLPVRTCKKK